MIEELHRACGHPLSAHNMDGRCMVDRCRCETDALAWRYMASERLIVVDKVTVRDNTAAGITAARALGEDVGPQPVPDRITAIQAWRGWRFRCDHGHDSRSCSDARLESITRDEKWPPNAALRATCSLRAEQRPIEQQRAEAERVRLSIDGRRSEYVNPNRKVYLNTALNPAGVIAGGVVERHEVREHLIEISEPRAHDVPVESCTCGIYAHKERQYILDHYDREVIGVVALWGKVIDGERAYRATFAKPIMLAVADPAMRAGIERLYTDCMVIDRALIPGGSFPTFRKATVEKLGVLGTSVSAPNPQLASTTEVDWTGAFRETLRVFLGGRE